MGLYLLKELLGEIENKVKSDQTDDLETLFEKSEKIHDESEVILKNSLENI